MRFLADENVPAELCAVLAERGDDVVKMGDLAPASDDAAVLGLAADQARVLLTLDQDFGRLIFVVH